MPKEEEIIEGIIQNWGLRDQFPESFPDNGIKLTISTKKPKNSSSNYDPSPSPLELRLTKSEKEIEVASKKLKKGFHSNFLLTDLASLYVHYVSQRFKNPGIVDIILRKPVSDRMYDAKILDRLAIKKSYIENYLKSRLNLIFNQDDVITLVPPNPEDPLPTYRSFKKAIVEAFTKYTPHKMAANLLGTSQRTIKEKLSFDSHLYSVPPPLLKLEDFNMAYLAFSNTQYIQKQKRGDGSLRNIAKKYRTGNINVKKKLEKGIEVLQTLPQGFHRFAKYFTDSPELILQGDLTIPDAQLSYIRKLKELYDVQTPTLKRILGVERQKAYRLLKAAK